MRGSAIPSPQIEQLREGATFVTQSRTVTEADLASFATLTGDLNPHHLDPEWAADGAFGEPVASGPLVLSFSLGLVRLDPRRAVALRGISDVVFTRPVKIGDTLTVAGEVSSLAPGASGTSVVTVILRTRNQHGKTVCRSRVQVVWRHGPDGPAGDAGSVT